MRSIIPVLVLSILAFSHSAFACGVPPFFGHTGSDLTIGAGGVYEGGTGAYVDIGITNDGDPEMLEGAHGYVGLHGVHTQNTSQAFAMIGIAPSDRPPPYTRTTAVLQVGLGYASVFEKNSVAGIMSGKGRFCPKGFKNLCIDLGGEFMGSGHGGFLTATLGFSFYAGSQMYDSKMRSDMGERNFAMHEAIWNY